MVERGTIVRESKFRHLFGKPWKKELCFTDVNLQTSANQSNAIQANDEFFCVPWETAGGGSLVLVPLSMKGPRIPARYPILNAHPSPVTDFQFHPFEPVLVSGARESTVKIWSLPDAPRDQEIPALPTISGTLEGHGARISHLRFHPTANHLLASGSGDKTIKLWDVEGRQSLLTWQEGISEVPTDLQWSPDGSLLACSFQKEKLVRVFDPRQKTVAAAFEAHDGAKGTYLTFMSNQRLLTVGFGKSSGGKSSRAMSVWDLAAGGDHTVAAASKPVAEDNFSATLIPYYDAGTGLAYLTGRGQNIFYYEINNSGEMIYPIGRTKTSISYTGATPLSKRVCDVLTCEMERFYLVSKDTVAMTSIICPRKSSQTIFQEDLYPAVPEGKPALTIPSWMDGKNAMPIMKSIQPDNLPSIFDVSKEEGGKSRTDELEKLRTRTISKAELDKKSLTLMKKPEITEGTVQVYTNGWFRKWGDRWMELHKDYLYVYEARDSPNMTLCVPVDSVTRVEISVEYNIHDARLFVLSSDSLSEDEHFYCPSAETCQKWIKSILLRREQATQTEEVATPVFSAAANAEAESATEKAPNVAPTVGAVMMEGWLEMYLLGYVYNGWVSRYFVLTEETLFVYKRANTTTNNPLEVLHMPKMISVSRSLEDHPNRAHTFKLCTATRVIHLASKEEDNMQQWINKLSSIIHPDDPILNQTLQEPSDHPDDNQSTEQPLLTEGYVMKKNGGVMGLTRPWTRYYLIAAGGRELLYSKNQRDTATRLHISVQSIVEVRVAQGYPELGFEIVTNDKQVHLHQAETTEDRDRWVESLQAMQNQSRNYLEYYGIDPNTIQTESRIKDSKIPHFIDPIDVKNGRCPLLIRVVGKRRIRTRLTPLSAAALTDTAVCVLDNGMEIFQWSGKKAPRVVKAKGWDLTNKIRTKERGGLAKVINLDQGKDANTNFWNLLGGKPAPKKTSEETLLELQKQQEEEDKCGDSIRIFRVGNQDTPEASRIKLVHEAHNPPPKEFLLFDSVSVVDCENEIFIWVGREASTYQRKLGLVLALRLQNEEGRPEPTYVSRVFEQGETILFKEKFSNYPGMLPIHVGTIEKKNKVAASKEQEVIDVQLMHKSQQPPADLHSDPDVAGSIVNVWHVDGYERTVLPKALWGQLWSGDSFVILYAFPYQHKEKYIIFFWQGKFSSRNEKGTSAYMTVGVSDEIGKAADQVRVVQDKEDEHFLRVMQKYSFVVHAGKYNGAPDALEARQSMPHLYIVKGDSDFQAHPVEVPSSSLELNTLHCAVLMTPNHCYVWKGALCNQHETDAATKFADSVSVPVVVGEEGRSDQKAEFEPFWKVVGHKGKYYGHDGSVASRKPLRLFTCSNATGAVQVEEVFHYAQEDTLHYEHILILDLFHEVFVWIGKSSTALEKKLGMEAAIEYVVSSPAGHCPDTPIWVIYPYAEPLAFTTNFPTWSREKYPAAKRSHPPAQVPVMSVLQDYLPKVYSYEELLQDPLPPGVDSTRLEHYLTEEEFEKVFKMKRAEFVLIPAWKADKIKQDVGLY